MICGHDRETLQWALRHEQRCGGLGGFDAVCRGNDSCTAWRDIIDPAKLAAIIAELLAPWTMFESWEAAGFVFIGTKADSTGYLMPQARVFALRLLDAPTATAQDIERMIGEL